MNKEKWLQWAEIIDAFRIIPRLMLLGFFIFYVWYIILVTNWFFSIDDQTIASTTFVTSTISAIGVMFTWFGGNVYMQTGRKWGNTKPSSE